MSIQPDIPNTGNIAQRITQIVGDVQRQVDQLRANAGAVPANGITGTQIKDGTITTTEIAAGTITATNIAAQAITTGLIAANAVTAAQIAANTITSGQIAANSIIASDLNVSTLSSISANLGTVTAGTITGGTIQTAATGGRVVFDSTGIKAYDASSVQQVNIDATTGLITANGVFLAKPGSTVPWQTTNFFIGGGNLMSNASGEDPTTTTQKITMTGGTAGTFTLQYGAGTVSAALNWNAAASDVQTALNAAGVLPSGMTATCTGGPLPGALITITLSGSSTPAVSLIAVASQSITGGTVTVRSAPSGWIAGSPAAATWGNGAVVDTFPFTSAWHGGNVLRITSIVTGDAQLTTNGPVFSAPWVPGTTRYTLSAYVRAPSITRSVQIQLQWFDINNVFMSTSTTVASWNTNNTWQRAVGTATPPVGAVTMHPVIQVTGMQAGEVAYVDGIQLEVGDAPTAFAPRPDEILANKIQANMINVAQLSAISGNIGTITAGTLNSVNVNSATVTGSLVQTSAANPRVWMSSTGLFATNSGGTQTLTVDATTGNITVGSSATITGATVRSSATDPKTYIDSTGLFVTNSGGSALIGVDATNGVRLSSGGSSPNYITWHNGTVGGSTVAGINAVVGTTNWNVQLGANNASVGTARASTITVQTDTSSDLNNFVSVSVWNASGSANTIVPIMNGAGQSAFVQAPNRNSGLYLMSRGASTINFPNSTVATQVSVSHGLGWTPTGVGFGVNGAPLANITFGAASWNGSTMNVAAFSSVVLNGNINFFWIVMS